MPEASREALLTVRTTENFSLFELVPADRVLRAADRTVDLDVGHARMERFGILRRFAGRGGGLRVGEIGVEGIRRGDRNVSRVERGDLERRGRLVLGERNGEWNDFDRGVRRAAWDVRLGDGGGIDDVHLVGEDRQDPLVIEAARFRRAVLSDALSKLDFLRRGHFRGNFRGRRFLDRRDVRVGAASGARRFRGRAVRCVERIGE